MESDSEQLQEVGNKPLVELINPTNTDKSGVAMQTDFSMNELNELFENLIFKYWNTKSTIKDKNK